jgi:alkylhydroperoxidase/carboxymuconolactone decarboxylase family protein YurZ
MVETRHTGGMSVRRDMFGPAGAEQRMAQATDFNRPFEELVTRYCFGDVWGRPGLDRKTRSLITLAALTALTKPNQLKVHVRGALQWRHRAKRLGAAAHQCVCRHPVRCRGFNAAAVLAATQPNNKQRG